MKLEIERVKVPSLHPCYFWHHCFLGLLLGALCLIACAPGEASGPSVLLITVDTLRGDRLGCTGYSEGHTPVLDRLAREGVLFDCCIVSAPITLPSHATIMTGLLPHELAVRDNKPFGLAREAETLAEVLKARGYCTLAVVSGEPLAHGCGMEQGFDAYRFKPGPRKSRASLLETTAEATTGLALETADSLEGGEPFFMWVHYFDPHYPYEPPARVLKKLPEGAAHPYDGEVAFVDQEIGRLLKGYEKKGLLDSTFLVVTSDHGEGLEDHGEPTHAFFLYDTTIKVPLVIQGPGIEAGRVCSSQVRSRDIKDLVLLMIDESEGETVTQNHAAREIAAYLREEGDALPATPAFSESLYCNHSFRWAQMTSMRTQEAKLIRGARDERFDLTEDPGELNPIALEKEDEVRSPLEQAMDRFKSAAAFRIARGPRLEFALPGYFGGTQGGERPFLDEAKNRGLPHPPLKTGTIKGLLTGVAQIDGGNLNRARLTLEEVVRLDPGNHTAWFWLGRVLRETAEKEGNTPLLMQAREHFLRALKLDPGFSDAFHMSVWCLIQLGAFDDANEALERWAKANAPNAKHWELCGYLLSTQVSAGRLNALFDPKRALECFDRSLKMAGNNPLLLQKMIDLAGMAGEKTMKREYEERYKKLGDQGWQ
ncbi:MAG: sulfatase-like hydrolase/transferase [Planctomycetota bacterium]|jgi:arylsulfatase A-like enzyme/Tfp pilus assembly protein PilF